MQQSEALAILKTGANVFLTGEPGSGKSYTVNSYVQWLRSCGVAPSVTASTGIAATHINGMTIHSWSGIGVLRTMTEYDLDRIAQNKNVFRRVSSAVTLIIDEVSMLSGDTLRMVDLVCKEIRRDKRPFGGLQVVLVGDFFQLPPVVSQKDRTKQEDLYYEYDKKEESNQGSGFAFLSTTWDALDPMVCYLEEQHRQNDMPFLKVLDTIRNNAAGESERAILRTRYAPRAKEHETQLFTHNVDVDSINARALDRLISTEQVFSMTSSGPEHLVQALVRGCISPEALRLKVGARVMFTKNDVFEHRFANGTLGVVEEFEKNSRLPVVRTDAGAYIIAEPAEWRIEDNGRTLASIEQIPLRLAWAITVHKSQGMSLDSVHMDLSKVFEYGQGYVALSRVRTLAGLTLCGLNDQALAVHPVVQQKDILFRSLSEDSRIAFSSLPSKEINDMHAQFIKVSGGKYKQEKKKKSVRKS